ncbi:protein-disulfide reductase DsbD family protein [Utexia brackfieldae]|uniref:protein-disulfide reductase DsbD family protein n=1 Tax=Utexia brackfieldae TaxID=3074108 RepID=UPI00370D30DE
MLFRLRFVLAGLLALHSAMSQATETDWLTSSNNAQIKLRANVEPTTHDIHLLLDIQLSDGWKTYWRSPGAGGEAPSISWQTPDLKTDWYWPTPERFDVLGLQAIGYQEHITLPLILTGSQPDSLQGTLTLPVCSNVCVLEDYPFTLALDDEQDTAFQTDFIKVMAAVPVKSGFIQQSKVSYHDSELQVVAKQASQWQNPGLYPDTLDGINFGKPSFRIDGNTLYASIPVTDDWGDKAPNIQGKTLSLVLADNQIAQEITAPITAEQLTQTTQSELSFWQAIAMALLGGLILNLMPCVLPVLGIKINHVLQASNHDHRQIRAQFTASWAGILFSFLLLALLMTLLRVTGNVLGWGIQFQNPWFIGLMVIVTALFTANLFDLFHIRLNVAVNTKLATHQQKGLTGAFLEGAFATLLATPCSAPFLGTAIAFALAAPLPMLWGIFIALGLGMGLPWLFIACYPKCATLLPKPGNWMNKLRAVLAILMLFSCLWLLSLLSIHIGLLLTSLIGILFLLLLIGAIGYRYGYKKALMLLLLTLAVVGLWVFISIKPASQTPDKIQWQLLSVQAIDEALAQHKRVFIDVTADWCITCKVNKINVILDPQVQQALQAPDVVALRGDWSKSSDEIADFLRDNGRFAIPFNQVMGPALPQGVILPTLLSKNTVLETLKQAQGDRQ